MDVEGNLLLAKLLIKKEKETLNGMIQTLLLLLLPLLFSTVQPVTVVLLLRYSLAAAAQFFCLSLYARASIGFNYFPSVSLLSRAAKFMDSLCQTYIYIHFISNVCFESIPSYNCDDISLASI